MALILNIDTALTQASIAISRDGVALATDFNTEQRDHASWIHRAINRLISESGLKMSDLDAIAVTSGPGSYTGLRVGLATAKGLCYGLGIPLITENTLRLMAFHAIQHYSPNQKPPIELFVPMIDARRMEVFTAVYDSGLQEVLAPQPMILDAGSLASYTNRNALFFGNGAGKFLTLVPTLNTRFQQSEASASDLGRLSYDKYLQQSFSDIAYSEPLYLKDFYIPEKK